MASEDERIDVEVNLENNLSKPAKVAEKSLDSLGDEATQVAGQMALLDENMEDVSQQATILAAQAKYAQMSLDGMGDAAKFSGKKFSGASDDIEDHTDKVDKSTKSTNKAIRSFLRITRVMRGLRFAMKALKFGLIIDGITFLITALQGLGAAAVAAINGLARLSGVLGAIPSLFGAAIQGVATFKIGVKGMGEALKLLGDPEATMKELNAAMQELAPSARGVVRELFALKGGWDVLQKDVQQSLFAGLSDDVRMLGAKYLPILRTNLRATATELNGVMDFTSRWLRKSGNIKAVNSVMSDNSFIVGRLGYAFSELFRATLHFMDAAGPMAKRMSADLASWVSTIANKIQGNKKGIGQWLMGSYENWLKAKDALADYGAAFFNIFKAATPLSNWMGRNIARIGTEFRSWSESKGGRKEIRQFFKDMRPVIQELAYWVRDLSKFFAGIAMDPDVFVPLSKQMREDLLPALEKIFKALSGEVLTAFIELAEAIGELADAGALEIVAMAIRILAKALKFAAWAFNKMPDWAQQIIVFAGALALLGRSRIGRGISMLIAGPLVALGTKLGSMLKGPMARFAGWFEKTFGAKALSRLKKFLGPLGKIAAKFAAFAAPGLFMGMGGKGAAGKSGKTPATGAPGAMMLPGMGDDDGKASKGKGKWRGRAAGAGRFAATNAAWMAAIPMAEGAWSEWQMKRGSDQAAASSGSAKNWQQIASQMQGTNLGEYAGELNININKLAKEMAKTGTSGSYYKEVDARLNKMEDRDWKDYVIGDMNPLSKSDRRKAQEARGTLGGFGKNVVSDTGVMKGLDTIDLMIDKMQTVKRQVALAGQGMTKLPKQVKTAILTPGLVDTTMDVEKLANEYNLTPQQVKTVIKALGGPQAIREADRTKNKMESLEGTYTAWFEFKRKINQAFNDIANIWNFAGGQVQAGQASFVGEFGPEAFVSNTGKIGMLGAEGMEFGKFPTGGAVIPTSATFNPQGGDTGNAPQWALNAFRRSVDQQSGEMSSDMSSGASGATQTVSEENHFHYHQTGDVHNAQPIDMQREFKKAFTAMLRDQKERK